MISQDAGGGSRFWAYWDWGEGKGKERQTRVELNTVFRRGKSDIPASRMDIEESRRESEDRRDVTDALSDAAEEEDELAIFTGSGGKLVALKKVCCRCRRVGDAMDVLMRACIT